MKKIILRLAYQQGRKTWALAAALLIALSSVAGADEKVDLALRDVEISAAMEMLSRREQANIVLEEGVSGTVSVNLYQVDIPTAIRTIANSGGFEVERRGKTYHVIKREHVNKHSSSSHVSLKTFKLKYADPTEMLDIVQQYLSAYGDVVVLADRNMLVVEDTPEFISRISTLIDELDYQPKQVLIEAKILEVRLDDQDSLGVEWSKLLGRGIPDDGVFPGPGTDGAYGTQGLGNPGGAGFFAQLGNDNIAALLDALETTGQARTLSTPTLLTLENEPAEVIVGNRLGYINTVTINQVTTETTEFLESGVILEVTPSVGRDGHILLDVHPEVSTGTVAEGIPSQDTTSVRTQLIVPDGGNIFYRRPYANADL